MSNNESLPILTHEKNLLTFWEDVIPNGLAGTKAGRVVFDKVLMMRVSSPGDKSAPEYEVDRSYPEEFPHPIHGKLKKNELVYAKFGKYIDDYKGRVGGSQIEAGTPIDHWALVDMRMAANLKFNGIYTVEALAAVSDGNAISLGMGSRELIQKAKDWLATAANTAMAMETEERNRKLQSQIDDLQAKYDVLAQSMEVLPEESKSLLKGFFNKKQTKAA